MKRLQTHTQCYCFFILFNQSTHNTSNEIHKEETLAVDLYVHNITYAKLVEEVTKML